MDSIQNWFISATSLTASTINKSKVTKLWMLSASNKYTDLSITMSRTTSTKYNSLIVIKNWKILFKLSIILSLILRTQIWDSTCSNSKSSTTSTFNLSKLINLNRKLNNSESRSFANDWNAYFKRELTYQETWNRNSW